MILHCTMGSITQFLKKHTVSIMFYLFYTLLCIRILQLNLDQNNAFHGKDGGLLIMFMFLMAIIFIVTNVINAIRIKTSAMFYLLLSMIIITQTVVVIYNL